MILLIDNYDSFSYNLVQLVGELQEEIKVVRNDEMSIEEIRKCKPSHVILSPGPGYPKNAGICEELVKECKGEFPILGVCLGHQAICEVYGAKIVHAKQLMHGKMSQISVDLDAKIFEGMDEQQKVARYHSLVAEPESLENTELKVISRDINQEVMAVCDEANKVYGLQFHPESILTENGKKMMINFLSIQ